MMTRRDFISMAHNYADGFNRVREYREACLIWDNLLGFTGIASASNPNFDRDKFLQEIADRMRMVYNAKGLADFNRLCWNRFGKEF